MKKIVAVLALLCGASMSVAVHAEANSAAIDNGQQATQPQNVAPQEPGSTQPADGKGAANPGSSHNSSSDEDTQS